MQVNTATIRSQWLNYVSNTRELSELLVGSENVGPNTDKHFRICFQIALFNTTSISVYGTMRKH